MLVVGFGRIGRAVAAQLHSMGCELIINDPFASRKERRVPIEELDFWRSCGGGRRLVARRETRRCWAPRNSLLPAPADHSKLRTGELVDEAALIQCLESGQVSRPGSMPSGRNRIPDPPSFDQVLVTPHLHLHPTIPGEMESEAARTCCATSAWFPDPIDFPHFAMIHDSPHPLAQTPGTVRPCDLVHRLPNGSNPARRPPGGRPSPATKDFSPRVMAYPTKDRAEASAKCRKTIDIQYTVEGAGPSR